MSHGTIPLGAEPKGPSVELSLLQLNRILDSNSFRNAQTLRQLLQFLATNALEGNSDGLKEYTIGVEVFGRKQDFDPKTDTIVRVQIHRLRQKLKEYYQAEGAHDPIRVEIPKGHYLPRFELLIHEISNGSGQSSEADVRPPAIVAVQPDTDLTGKPGSAFRLADYSASPITSDSNRVSCAREGPAFVNSCVLDMRRTSA